MQNDMQHLHLDIGENPRGRDFFVGDLHGMYDALTDGLEACGFDRDCDRLISVGDLIDRGPESMAAMALVEEPWFYGIRGNHEQMMLNAFGPNASALSDADRDDLQSTFVVNGGSWFEDLPDDLQQRLLVMAASLPLAITVSYGSKKIGVTHAEWAYPTIDQPDWAFIDKAVADTSQHQHMLWGRRVIKNKIIAHDRSASLTIHGHTPINAAKAIGTALFIDTGSVYGGPLTIISAEEALMMVGRSD